MLEAIKKAAEAVLDKDLLEVLQDPDIRANGNDYQDALTVQFLRGVKQLNSNVIDVEAAVLEVRDAVRLS